MMRRERYQLSVAVFVVLRRDDEICLIRRANTGWMDGFYSLPAGGLENGETQLSAAAREANEETGVTINTEQLKLGHSMHVKTEDRSWMGPLLSLF
ncbi:8-oxo-dGTP diphosphatase [Cedecea neteri]|uniref:8-oxo-dGTP diphosphatase n=1 Tax=Cedecea neteri TaxID=158822 RepID=A0A2X3IPE3_9ENTR|nr:8-oxo-dGTP diphosphatase [Cedecea neteri]